MRWADCSEGAIWKSRLGTKRGCAWNSIPKNYAKLRDAYLEETMGDVPGLEENGELAASKVFEIVED